MPFADNPTACTNKCPQFSISAQQNCIAGQLCLIFVPKHTIYLHIRLYTTRFPLYGLVPAIQNCANNLQQSSCAQHSVCFFFVQTRALLRDEVESDGLHPDTVGSAEQAPVSRH